MSSLSHTAGLVLGKGGATAYGGPSGRTFFVNTNTSGAKNIGRTWYDVDGHTVFVSLQAAINACVADRGDVIYVAQGVQNPSTQIAFNKQGITVIGATIGASYRGGGRIGCWIDSTYSDGPAVLITKGCHIKGLGFGGDCDTAYGAGSRKPVMALQNSGAGFDGWGTWIEDCVFRSQNNADLDCLLLNEGAPSVRVLNSWFIGGDTNGLDAAIIGTTSSAGRPYEIDIDGCYAEDCTYLFWNCEDGSGYPVRSMFRNNYFGYSNPDLAWVKAIRVTAGPLGALGKMSVTNNYFMQDPDLVHSKNLADMEAGNYIHSGNHYKTDLSQLA